MGVKRSFIISFVLFHLYELGINLQSCVLHDPLPRKRNRRHQAQVHDRRCAAERNPEGNALFNFLLIYLLIIWVMQLRSLRKVNLTTVLTKNPNEEKMWEENSCDYSREKSSHQVETEQKISKQCPWWDLNQGPTGVRGGQIPLNNLF